MHTADSPGQAGLTARLPGVVLFGFAVVYGIAGTQIEYAFSSDPLGPRSFPVILSLLLAVLAVWYALRPGNAEPWPRGRLLARLVGLLVLSALSATLYVPLGFPLATLMMCAGTAILFDATPRQAIACGVGNAALWYGVFVHLLGVPLPVGTLFGG
ncbi:tripartite tricarboxylate transporter TctB family protein [Azospirillum halopraeferens]|uniref:tripartite tricarboxylate transporter TctB family protein n=1 Tax=Azospirillum halopraeferens TaxID=34010 RepID=UPI000422EA54|nr:tripartite tricarboxylate transporter TctB family protein [Azospirillum halopraeferens]